MDSTGWQKTTQFNGIMLDRNVEHYSNADALMVENMLFAESDQLATRGGVKYVTQLDSEVVNIFSSGHSLLSPLVFTKKSSYRIDNVNTISGTFDVTRLSLNTFYGGNAKFDLCNFNSFLIFISQKADSIYYSFRYREATTDSLVWHKLNPVVSNVKRDNFFYKTTIISSEFVFKYGGTLFLANIKEKVDKVTLTGEVIDSSVFDKPFTIRWCSVGLNPIVDIATIPQDLQIDDSIVDYAWDISDARSTAGFLVIPDASSPIASVKRSTDGMVIYLENGASYILNAIGDSFSINRLAGQLGYILNKHSTVEYGNLLYGISTNGLFVTDKTSSNTLYSERCNIWSNLLEVDSKASLDVTIDPINNQSYFLYPIRRELLLSPSNTNYSTLLNMHTLTGKLTVTTLPLRITALSRYSLVSLNISERLKTWNDMLDHYNASVWTDMPINETWDILLKGVNKLLPNDLVAILYGDIDGNIGFLNLQNQKQDKIDATSPQLPIMSRYLTHYYGSSTSLTSINVGVRSVGNTIANINSEISFSVFDIKNNTIINNKNSCIINKPNIYNNIEYYSLGNKRIALSNGVIDIRFKNTGGIIKLFSIEYGINAGTVKRFK